LRFDANGSAQRGGVWSVFAYLQHAGLVALLGTIAALFLSAGVLRGRSLLAATLEPRGFVLHALSFAVFLAVSHLALGRADRPPPGPALVWVALWVGTGFAVVAALVRALFDVSLGGTRLVGLAAGASVLGVLAWQIGEWARSLWEPLARVALAGTAALLSMFSSEVAADPQALTLRLEDFEVMIAAPCSGFEGMGLMSVLLGVYLFAFRCELRFPNAWLLLPLGVATIFGANLVRLAGLMAVGAYWSPDVADNGFHSKAGWALFCATTLLVAGLGRRLAFFSRASVAHEDEAQPDASDANNPSVAYLLPLLALIACGLFTGMFVKQLDQLYWLRVVVLVLVLVVLRRAYRDLSRRFSWLSVGVGALVALIWLVVPAPEREEATLAAFAAAATPAWLLVRALGSATIVPIAEELAFRGYLLRWLISREFERVSLRAWTPWAILASSIAFGVLHERWFVATLAGAAFAFTQIRTGRLSDAVVAHAVSNALIAMWVLATGDFTHWM
jgi:exosortase E/protease (VPEID-CTERM system)